MQKPYAERLAEIDARIAKIAERDQERLAAQQVEQARLPTDRFGWRAHETARDRACAQHRDGNNQRDSD